TRASNVYGGGDFNWDRLIPGIIQTLYKGKTPILRSDGSFVRDYLFIEDMVQAYLTLGRKLELQNLSGEVFNFGTSKPTTVIEVYHQLAKIMGKQELVPVI